MENHVYADDVGAIAVTGPIVRFDLMIQPTTEKDTGGKPPLVVTQTVIMPLDGYLRAVARMQTVVQDLEKKGVIKRGTRERKDATSSG